MTVVMVVEICYGKQHFEKLESDSGLAYIISLQTEVW